MPLVFNSLHAKAHEVPGDFLYFLNVIYLLYSRPVFREARPVPRDEIPRLRDAYY